MAAPRVIIKRAANSAAPANAGEPAGASDKKASGLKVVVRRLPPAMSRDEFETRLPPEFRGGSGKVDWFEYRAGKVTTNPAKISRPSRAYLHLVDADDAVALSEGVQRAIWEDAKGSWNDASLIGPPVVEKAPCRRTPKAKERIDSRQGTIDQDPEFQEFLRSLTEPPTKAVDGEKNDDTDEDKVTRMTTTPLIEFLKEKKAKEEERKLRERQAKIVAAKAKAAAAALVKEEAKKKEKEEKEKEREREREKPKEPIKILKKGSGSAPASSAGPAKAEAGTSERPAPPGQNAQQQPRRRLMSSAATILQRDLGIGGVVRKRERQDAKAADRPEVASGAKAELGREPKEVKAKEVKEDTRVEPENKARDKDAAEPSSSTTAAGNGNRAPAPRTRTRGGRGRNSEKSKATAEPRAPVVLLRKGPENADPRQEEQATIATASHGADTTSQQPSSSTAHPTSKPQTEKATPPPAAAKGNPRKDKKPAAPGLASISPGATEGFIKNMKGTTEESLREKLEEFGKVVSIDIKKGKWHAFVEFEEHDALVRAAAAPISVGETTFQVVEKRDKEKPAPAKEEGPAKTAEETGGKEGKEPSSRRSGRGRRGRGGKAGASGEAAGGNGD